MLYLRIPALRFPKNTKNTDDEGDEDETMESDDGRQTKVSWSPAIVAFRKKAYILFDLRL